MEGNLSHMGAAAARFKRTPRRAWRKLGNPAPAGISPMPTVHAYGTHAASQPLTPLAIDRRTPGPHDVQIAIDWCGVCHSDLHTARNEWHSTQYPCVPGHEIVGRVTAVGAQATKFKVGDSVGVGCMVDSCRQCAPCAAGEEQYCEQGCTGTYNGPMRGGANTWGGYSESIVVD